jgi:membrane protein DedA with SNARE-associated domain
VPYFRSHDLAHLLALYGYWAVLAFVLIESLGIPFPGETMLIAASLYAGSTHRLSIGPVIAAAAAGAILGDNLGYAIGRVGGYPLLRRYGRYVRIEEGKLKLGQYLFLKYGGKVVFFGRFVAVLRTFAALLAGVNRMPWRRFLAYNAAGGILWAALYGVGAFVLGQTIQRFAGPVGIALGIGAAVVVLAFLIVLARNERRLEAEAERALPGPLDHHRAARHRRP